MRQSGHRSAKVIRWALVVFAVITGAELVQCSAPTGPSYPHVAVLYDLDSTLVRGGRISLTNTSRSFYREYPDYYDFLAVYTLEHVTAVEAMRKDFADYLTVRNDVSGIGFSPTYDLGEYMGSKERLQGVIFMNALWEYYDPQTRTILPRLSWILAHETGHRFGAYVWADSAGIASQCLLDNFAAHWTLAMHTGGSPMGGFDWRDNGDGTFTAMARWTGLYSMLDLYLMGLARPEEVGPITMLSLNPKPDSVALGTTLPATTWTAHVEDIIAVEGPRIPPFGEAPTTWRTAFVLVVPNSKSATYEAISGLDAIRSYWSVRFSELTRGRGHMMTEMLP